MITAEEVKFDQFGQWQHSAIHALGEEFDEVPFKDIPAFNGLRMKVIRVWDEEDQNRLGGYPNSNMPADFRKWQPEPPDGDGWFPFSYSDDEDGAYVLYARQKQNDRPDLPTMRQEPMATRRTRH